MFVTYVTSSQNGGFLKWGYPNLWMVCGWFIMENPAKLDLWDTALVLRPPVSGLLSFSDPTVFSGPKSFIGELQVGQDKFLTSHVP